MKLTKEGIAVIDGDEYLSRDIEVQGRLDVAREELEKYRQYIPEGGVVVDVGACLGDYTATFSEFVGELGRVYAFEPNPPVLDCLIQNMSSYPNVIIRADALGPSTMKASVVEDARNIGASWLTHDGVGDVYVMSLNFVAAAWPRMDFLKLDAEGYEPWILDGGVEAIMRLRPVMLIEVDQRALGMHGFKPADIHERLDILDYHFPRFDGAHGDILCIPKERMS